MDQIEKINLIISETFKIPINEIENSLSPDDIEEWDSLGQMTLIQAIEEELEIELDMDEIFSIYNLGDLYKVLHKRNLLRSS